MKKLSLVSVLVLLIFASCKKENSGNNFHVNFTVDGVNKTYTGYVWAHIDSIGGSKELTILGSNTPTSFNDYLGIYINNDPSGSNIPAGEYPDNSPNFTVLSTYQNNTIEYESGQSVAEDAASYNVSIAHPFKVTITSIDGQTARGTFSGDYYQEGDVHSSKVYISNGDFYVKFK